MKLNNLSRLTALLLALTIFLSSVAWADPVAEGDYTYENYEQQLAAQTGTCETCVSGLGSFPTTDHNGNTIEITCVYDHVVGLGSAQERYNFLYYVYNNMSYSYYATYLQEYNDHLALTDENGNQIYEPLLCNCKNINTELATPGTANHTEGCPWYTDVIVIIPDIPQPDPIDPEKFEQYTSNAEYTLPMANDRAIILPEGGRAVIHSNVEAADGYQWQVYDGTQWVSIAGETAADLVVTTAKLATIFDLTGIAELRYFDTANDIVKASVSVTSQEIAGGEYIDPVAEAQEQAQTLSLTSRDGESTSSTYTIKVYYYYEGTTTPVYREDSATYSAGATVNWPVTYPVLVGYEAWWMGRLDDVTDNDTAASTSHNISINELNENISYVVYYKPANVGFKVLHYLQNIEDDNYAAPIVVEWDGYTNESVLARLNGQDKEALIDTRYDENGFYALPFSTDGVIVAADGSTEVEIYYDRYYRLMNFELNGGYGVEPIYAKYGSAISVGTPERAGYSFVGWAKTADGESDANLPPATMPAEHVTYYALWKMNDTAKVSIVFWGENADDEEYSYIKTSEIYVKPGTSLTYTENSTLICGLDIHAHSAECGYTCGETEHSHTESCYKLTCELEESEHSTDCYENVGSVQPGNGAPSNPVDGQVWEWSALFWSGKNIYINGSWYEYSGDLEDGEIAKPTCDCHIHEDACYTLTCTTPLHTHSAECGYKCGQTEHNHSSTCYMAGAGLDSSKWKLVKSDTVTVEADGSTVMNVYYDRVEYSVQFYSNQNCSNNNEYTNLKITAKWGAKILDKWPTYNGSKSWLVEGKANTWQNSIQVMPVGGAKFWGPKTGNSSYSAYYYVEALPGDENTFEHNGVTYKLHHTDTSVSSGNVTDEERYAINGFTYKEGTANGESYSNAKFYYTRNRYNLVMNNGEVEQYVFSSDTDEYPNPTGAGVMYEAPLSTYDTYMPTPPSFYEPGSVTFGGWYLNPECTGDEFDLTVHTMPADNLLLYAKWEPVTYTVNFYLTDAKYGEGLSGIYTPKQTTDADGNAQVWGPASFTVQHGAYIAKQYVEANLDYSAMVQADPNNPYIFVYWKYWDEEAGEWKAFNPTSPVRKNLDLIGVWSSNTLVNYKVYFVDQATGTIIADTISGQALAGSTKSFDAKGGTALYDLSATGGVNYQTGYFPIVPSHSITMDLLDETKNEFTFYYIKATAVPYTVYYLAEKLAPDDTSLGTLEVNGTKYHIIAETQNRPNTEGKSVVTEQYVHVDGYLVDVYQKTLTLSLKKDQNGNYVPNDEENVIYFFYTVNADSTSYRVIHYKEVPQDTEGATAHAGKYWGVYQDDTKPGEYGKNVAETALDIPYYTYDSTVDGTLTSGTPVRDAEQLVLKFYYTEDTATINYVPVGPNGAWDGAGTTYVTGTTDKTSETVKKVTDTAVGATATSATNEYKFVGWYDNAACEGDPISTNAVFIPTKTTEQVWPDSTTYYAKFVVDKAVLTIKKTGMTDGEVAVFNVSGPGYNGKVIVPNGTTGVKLYVTCGEYTITEVDAWSWRYTLKEVKVDGTLHTSMPEKITLDADGTTIEVVNNRTNDHWLSDEGTKVNKFNGEP